MRQSTHDKIISAAPAEFSPNSYLTDESLSLGSWDAF
jgi:hypothetical protein